MKIPTTQANKTSSRALKTGAIVASAIIPAAYMTKYHINLYPKENKKGRAKMRNKMIGFFAGIGLSTMLVHKKIKIGKTVFFNSKGSTSMQALKILAAAIAPFAGLEGAKKINKSQLKNN